MAHKFIVAIRTHFWDDTVQQIAQLISSSTTAEVVVSVDETNGIVEIPSKYRKISHSIHKFANLGLPLTPSDREALWFNGDYPLYDLAEELEFDYLLMIESDCALVGDLDALFKQLINDGVELATKNDGDRLAEYMWYKASHAWFGPRTGVEKVRGGIFPVVFISKPAIKNLRTARLEMAAQTGGDASVWPHCETFTATQLHFSGFKSAPLRSFADTSQLTVDLPVHVNSLAAMPIGPKVKFFHPVLAGQKYELKQHAHYRKLFKHVEKLAGEISELRAVNKKQARVIKTQGDKISKLSNRKPPTLFQVINSSFRSGLRILKRET